MLLNFKGIPMNSQRFDNLRRYFGYAALLLLICAPSLSAANASSDASFVIRYARVFDGHEVTQVDVWVRDGKIEAVGRKLKVPVDVKTIDASGDTLLPGLIDSHTHADVGNLKEAEIFGVTTELDMFCDVKFMQQTKNEQAEGKDLDQADLRSAG